MKLFLVSLAIAAAAFLTMSARAADVQVVDMPAGQQVDVFSEVNTTGTVFVKIVSSDGGDACADFWWIKWPFGSVSQAGRHCNFAKLPIPTIYAGAVGSKLRAGGGSGNLKLGVSSDERSASSITLEF